MGSGKSGCFSSKCVMELSRLISLIWLLSGGGAEQGKEPAQEFWGRRQARLVNRFWQSCRANGRPSTGHEMGIRRPFSNPKWQPDWQLRVGRQRKIPKMLPTWFPQTFESEVARQHKGRPSLSGEKGQLRKFPQERSIKSFLNAARRDRMESQWTLRGLMFWAHETWDGPHLLVTYCVLRFGCWMVIATSSAHGLVSQTPGWDRAGHSLQPWQSPLEKQNEEASRTSSQMMLSAFKSKTSQPHTKRACLWNRFPNAKDTNRVSPLHGL